MMFLYLMLSSTEFWGMGSLDLRSFYEPTQRPAYQKHVLCPRKEGNGEVRFAQWSVLFLSFFLYSTLGGGEAGSFSTTWRARQIVKPRRVASLPSGVYVPHRGLTYLLGYPFSVWVLFISWGWQQLCKEWVKECWCGFPFLVLYNECNWFWFSCLTNENLPQNSIRKKKQVNPAEGKDSRNPVSVTNRFMRFPEALKKKWQWHWAASVNK